MKNKFSLIALFVFLYTQHALAIDVPEYKAELLRTYQTFDARQAVAVDNDHFYAIDSFKLSKHRKSDGTPIIQWDGESYGKVAYHLDSAMVVGGKIYASHSNYGLSPMTSSVEVWDAKTLEHIESHSFGIHLGSFTWLDRHGGYWWGAFANYDKVQKKKYDPYGKTENTKVVKMDNDFRVISSWTLPETLLARMRPMSNSGGSWGADGYLYLTGHDYGEIFVMQIPEVGSILHHAATVKIEHALEGQGIAWDRSEKGAVLWGVRKKTRQVYKMRMPKISNVASMPQGVLRTNNFSKK